MSSPSSRGYVHLLLSAALQGRAAWTESRLDLGHAHGVKQQEETITESVLLDLANTLPHLKIRTFSRQEESRDTGADWLWWWQGRSAWFGAFVQAKLLKQPRSSPNYELGYRPKGPGKGSGQPQAMRQIDRLMEAARAANLPALFALYNSSVPGGQARAMPCPVHSSGSPAEGITILDAGVANQLLRLHGSPSGQSFRRASRIPLSSIAPHARPWSCLATCALAGCESWPGTPREAWQLLGFPQEPDATDLAFDAAYASFQASRSLLRTQFREATTAGLEESIRRGVRAQPPAYVLEPDFLREGWDVDDDPHISPGNVAHVVIVQAALQ